MIRSPRAVFVASLLAAASAMVLSACSSSGPRNVYNPPSEGDRNPARAAALTARALAAMPDRPQEAERLLREALAADLYHAPAHNNLGVLFLNQGRLYEAANEFEWARKLLPGHPDPRLNLGLTLERAGRIDDAIDTYRTALEVYAGHVPSIQALARAQLRHNRPDAHTPRLLETIALEGTSPEWRQWAQEQQHRLAGRAE